MRKILKMFKNLVKGSDSEKWKVVCDETNNSEEDIKNNRIVCKIFPSQKNIVVKFTVTPKE